MQSYRDEQGRPRQRRPANLHGETDLLRALAKLAALREAPRKERAELSEFLEKFNELVCAHPVEELNRIVRTRDWAKDRLEKVDNELAAIQKDGVATKRHCDTTPEKIQAAIQTFKKELHDAEGSGHVEGPLGQAKAGRGQCKAAPTAARAGRTRANETSVVPTVDAVGVAGHEPYSGLIR